MDEVTFVLTGLESMLGFNATKAVNHLYPYDADDYVFLIYHTGQINKTVNVKKNTATPIMQWFAIIILCSLALHALRKLAGGNTSIRRQLEV